LRVRASLLWPALVAGALLVPVPGQPAGAQELRYSGSLGLSRGSYVLPPGRSGYLILLNGLSFYQGPFLLSATLPVIGRYGEGAAFLSGGRMPEGGAVHEGVAHQPSGRGMGMGGDSPGTRHASVDVTVGDPLLRASIRLHEGGAGGWLAVDGMVKAPLAPASSGAGTGAWDLGLGGSAAVARGRSVLLAGVSAWSPGDLPEVVLRNYVGVSLGAGFVLGPRWSVLASVSATTPILQDVKPPASAGLSLGLRTGVGRILNAGFSAGLTEGSPDLTVFLGWSFGLAGGRPVEGRNPGMDGHS
jgi:hypothetical protein